MTMQQTPAEKSPIIPERFPAPPMDQFMYLVRILHDGQGRCVVTFAGQVDAERMARAVRLTLDAEPVLGCRFVEHPRRPYWERRDDLDRTPLCPVVEPPDLESALWQFMAAPVDPCAGPQLQARLFRSDRDTLCIRINHMVADAGGTMDYVGLLARTYRELSLDPTYRPQPNLRGNRGQGQVLRRVGLRSLLRACCRFSYPRSAWGFPATSRDFSGRSFAIRRIAPERLASIKAYCHQHQATVNDVLLAAFYRALFEVLDPPLGVPLPVQMTVNLRRYLPAGQAEAICNLVGVFFPAITRKQGATFGDTLAETHVVMEAAKVDHPWLGEALYIELAFLSGLWLVRRIAQRIIGRAVMSGKMHPFFANVGIVDPRQVDFGDERVIDVALFGPVPYPPACLLSVNTFGETMIVTTGFCTTATDRRMVERFLDLFVCELPA